MIRSLQHRRKSNVRFQRTQGHRFRIEQLESKRLLATINGTAGGNDSWNDAGNWDTGVPSGAESAVVAVDANATTIPPTYSGGLTLNAGTSLTTFGSDAINALGTGDITMNSGSEILLRTNNGSSYTFVQGRTITLAGDATIWGGRSTAGHHTTRTFEGPISGPGALTIDGVNNNTIIFDNTNTFSSFVAQSTQNQGFRVEADQPGSLGTGDVAIENVATLEINVDNVIDDGARLTLNGDKDSRRASKLIMDANDTVDELFIDGVQLAAGDYTESSGVWISGAGTLTVLTGAPDVPPTLASSDFVDDVFGGPIFEDLNTINYTVTFSEDMDASTITAADFGNAGSATLSIGDVTETSTSPAPSVFSVEVMPTSTGTLQLQVNAGAVLQDETGNDLDTTSAIADDTTITINAGPTPPTTIFDSTGGNDSWNVDSNWDNGVPFGAGSAIVGTNIVAQVNNASTPSYDGSLALQANSTLRINNRDSISVVETPSNITLDDGATIDVRDGSPTFGPIDITGSTSIEAQSNGAHHETFTFSGAISGTGGLLVNGLNNDTFHLDAASTFSGGFIAESSANQGFRVEANATGSLGSGNVTINNAATLIVDATNAIDDRAILFLNGAEDSRRAAKLIMNFDDVISELWIDGVMQPPGDYTSAASFIDGNGVLMVLGDIDPPLDAIDDDYTASNPISEDQTLTISDGANDLLANDTPPDAPIAAFDTTSLNGAAVTVNADGSFSYDPSGSATIQALNSGEALTDTFTYSIGSVTNITGEILATDFNGRTVNGNTASSITWTTNGVADPGDLTAIETQEGDPGNQLNGLFDTGNTSSHFAPDLNTDNEDNWRVEIPLVLSASSITIDDVVLDGDHFNNSGVNQGVGRDTDFVVSVTGSVSGEIATETMTSGSVSIDWNLTFFDTFAPLSLTDSETWTLAIATTNFPNNSGNNAGLDGITVNGSFPESTTDTATVSVRVTGEDEIDAIDDDYTTSNPISESEVLTIPDGANDLLANDTPSDATITAFDATSVNGASVSVNADGSFTYDPSGSAAIQALGAGQSLTDTFTYTIDGADTATVSVLVNGEDSLVAVDDDYAVSNPVTESGTLDTNADGAPSVLANDTPTSATIVGVNGTASLSGTSAEGANVTVSADGSFVYDTNGQFEDLAAGASLPDSFTYTIDDGNGAMSTATVSLLVTGENDVPVSEDVAIAANEDGPAVDGSFDADDIDSNDDPSSLTYMATTTPAEGSVVNHNDGTFAFDPGTDFQDLAQGATRVVTFDYTATDSESGVSNTSSVNVTVTGVNDAPTVGVDNPTATADEGQSATNSGTFADIDTGDAVTISASAGTVTQDDTLGTWSWSLAADDGPDESQTVTITATDGAGATNTLIFDLTVNNVAPAATLSGPSEALVNTPVSFAFAATDPSTADQTVGFTFTVDWGDGTIDSSTSHTFSAEGQYTVTLTATDKDGDTSAPVSQVIDITSSLDPVVQVGEDIVVTGTSASDRIIFLPVGGGFRVRFNNQFFPLDGSIYSVNAGTQLIVNANEGSDTVIVHGTIGAPAVFDGGEGNDYLSGGTDGDTLIGGLGNDVLLGGEGDNRLEGGDGNDRAEGRDGIDLIFGGIGNDRLNGGGGNDIIDGGSGNDLIHGGLGDDLLAGREGSDTISGYYGNDILYGGEGADQLFGGSGNDLIFGGIGTDRVRGDNGDDTLIGGTSALETDTESSLDALLVGGSMSTSVQAALDAWFASQGETSRMLYEPFADDSSADELTGGSGVDTFQAGANDRLRDVRDGDVVLP